VPKRGETTRRVRSTVETAHDKETGGQKSWLKRKGDHDKVHDRKVVCRTRYETSGVGKAEEEGETTGGSPVR